MPLSFLLRDACPLCSAQASRVLCDLAFDDTPLGSFLRAFYGGRLDPARLAGGRYRVLECSACGFVYQQEILDDAGMDELYGEWVDQAQSLEKKRNMSDSRRRQYAGQVELVWRLFARDPEQVRVLDFGMGWGYWCQAAQQAGFDVSGFELSQQRARHARELGVKTLRSLAEAAAGFDFIFANQVFEHLPDPLTTLRELAGCLREDGFVYLRVPDGRGLARRLRREDWQPSMDAVHPLEHINCFTRATLQRLASSAGLRPASPPWRIRWSSPVASLRREIADRCLTTHLLLRR